MVILSANTWLQAVKEGHLDKLQKLHQKGCPTHKKSLYYASLNKHWYVVKWLHKRRLGKLTASTWVHAVKDQNMEMIEWLYLKRCVWSAHALTLAIGNNYLKIAQKMIEWGCPISKVAVNVAVEKQNITMLNYLMQYDAPKSSAAFKIAANNNDLSTMLYLYNYGFILTSEVLSFCHDYVIKEWVKRKLEEEDLIFRIEVESNLF